MGNKTDMYPSIPNIKLKMLKYRIYFCNTLILIKNQRYFSASLVLHGRYKSMVERTELTSQMYLYFTIVKITL